MALNEQLTIFGGRIKRRLPELIMDIESGEEGRREKDGLVGY